MARSVSTPRNSVHVSYQSIDTDRFYCSECGENFDVFACKEDEEGELVNVCPHCAASRDVCFEEDQYDNFQNSIDCLFTCLKTAFPSISKDDTWIDREDHAIASNSFAYFGVSEYCGLVAVWVAPVEDHEQPGLQERWIDSIGDKFENAVGGCFGTNLKKVATFSNGEAMFRAANPVETKGELGLGRSSKEGWI